MPTICLRDGVGREQFRVVPELVPVYRIAVREPMHIRADKAGDPTAPIHCRTIDFQRTNRDVGGYVLYTQVLDA